jgi:hypothetical protein
MRAPAHEASPKKCAYFFSLELKVGQTMMIDIESDSYVADLS